MPSLFVGSSIGRFFATLRMRIESASRHPFVLVTPHPKKRRKNGRYSETQAYQLPSVVCTPQKNHIYREFPCDFEVVRLTHT